MTFTIRRLELVPIEYEYKVDAKSMQDAVAKLNSNDQQTLNTREMVRVDEVAKPTQVEEQGNWLIQDDDGDFHPVCIVLEKELSLSGDSRNNRMYNEAFFMGIIDEVVAEINLWHGDPDHAEEHCCTIYDAIKRGVSDAELIELAFEIDKDLFRNWHFDGGVDIVPIEQFGCYAAKYKGAYFDAPMHTNGAMLFEEFSSADHPEDGFEDAVDKALEELEQERRDKERAEQKRIMNIRISQDLADGFITEEKAQELFEKYK